MKQTAIATGHIMGWANRTAGRGGGMMENIQVGDIVQLDPCTTKNPMFRGCLMVVTEIKSWGVQGYVQAIGTDEKIGGQAYYRASDGTFERCGKAVWVAGNEPDLTT